MKLPLIPNSWIIAILAVCLVLLRFQGIDSWTTAALGLIIGYLTGQHIEAQTKKSDCKTNAAVNPTDKKI